MDNHTIFKIEDKNYGMIILPKLKGIALCNEHRYANWQNKTRFYNIDKSTT